MPTDATVRIGGGQPQTPAMNVATPPPAGVPSVALGGPTIPGYTLHRLLGRGGMGAVYEALQHDPPRRVALKLIARDALDPDAAARFAVERQAVARLDHPHVARVYDAGHTTGGVPYFAMELVNGPNLTAYCRDKGLGVRERLTLFAGVCRAVQHAHQKGVIHRDLKPGNILVAEVDGKAVPKVIDFGVAKLMGEAGGGASVTRFGLMAGTPLYMAPEQANPFAHIDTRADVYALGVILFELLTDRTLLDATELETLTPAEILRRVHTQTPIAPSVVAAPGVAGGLRGELDWVVLQCLQHEPGERYPTADQLAADVERYLRDEPVSAHPPSRWYTARKFVRRNRGPVSAAAAVLTLLVAGVIGTGAGLLEARQQERRAVAGERAAERRAGQLQRTNEVLADVFRDLNPRLKAKGGQPVQAVLGERLVEAAKQLDDSLGDPLAVADLRYVLGQSLLTLGYPNDARPQFERVVEVYRAHLGPFDEKTLKACDFAAECLRTSGNATEALARHTELLDLRRRHLGEAHPDVATSLSNLALCHTAAGRPAAALPLLEEAVRLSEAALGRAHLDTLLVLGNLASCWWQLNRLDRAIAVSEDILARQTATLGPDHPNRLTTLNNLAVHLQTAGQYQKALERHQECRTRRHDTLGPDHPDTLGSTDNLALTMCILGDPAKALPLHERALAGRTAMLGASHPDSLTTLGNLAGCYRALGRFDDALKLYEQLVERRTRVLGPDHPGTLSARSSLAGTLINLSRFADAKTILTDNLQRQVAGLGENHPLTLLTRSTLGWTLCELRDFDLAVTHLEAAAKGTAAVQGADHPDTLNTQNLLAETFRSGGQLTRAVALAEQIYQARRKKLGDAHPDTITSLNYVALNECLAGRYDAAAKLWETAYQRGSEVRGADHPDTLVTLSNLSGAHCQAGNVTAATRTYEAYLNALRKRSDTPTPQLAAALASSGSRLLGVRQYPLAEQFLRDCLTARQALRVTDWTLSNTESLLGEALLGQKKYTEAEPLLRAGYEGLKAKAAAIPGPLRRERLEEALERLVRLATEAGKPDDLKKWEAERATLPREQLPPPRKAAR
jgi:tetratricopeptide (TPR) repeat protein